MARCRCGIELDAGWKFCKACGAPSQVPATAAPSLESGAPERPKLSAHPGMCVRVWSSIRRLPFWQKGCLGCGAVWVTMMVFGFVMAIAGPMIDPAGHEARVELRRQEEEAARKSRVEEEARDAEAKKGRLEVTTSPGDATVTLFLNGSQIGQESGTCKFEGLKPGAQYTLKVAAPGYETQKKQVSVPRTGAVAVNLDKMPDLELLDLDSKADDFLVYATGHVRNNTDRNYGYVQIQINELDQSGAIVGSTMANMNNLGPGETWSFKAPLTSDGVKFRVKDITGF